MQASLAVVGSLAFASWWIGKNSAWLLGGILLPAVIPFTLVVISRTNGLNAVECNEVADRKVNEKVSQYNLNQPRRIANDSKRVPRKKAPVGFGQYSYHYKPARPDFSSAIPAPKKRLRHVFDNPALILGGWNRSATIRVMNGKGRYARYREKPDREHSGARS
jgi:hypothetical protein